MQDIALIKNEETGFFDIAIKDGDIQSVDNFDTALNSSVLLDSRASARVAAPEKRNGWLGNLVSIVEGRQVGSHLWLLSQARLTQSSVNEAVDYVRKSLEWLVQDKVCSNLAVSGEVVARLGIRIRVDITALSGKLETRFFNLWENTGQ